MLPLIGLDFFITLYPKLPANRVAARDALHAAQFKIPTRRVIFRCRNIFRRRHADKSQGMTQNNQENRSFIKGAANSKAIRNEFVKFGALFADH
jgi:hypothetical protein